MHDPFVVTLRAVARALSEAADEISGADQPSAGNVTPFPGSVQPQAQPVQTQPQAQPVQTQPQAQPQAQPVQTQPQAAPTEQDVMTALQQLQQRFGPDPIISTDPARPGVLHSHGVTRVSELRPDQYPSVIDMANRMLSAVPAA